MSKFKLFVAGILVVAFIFLFYWFQVRPVEIRKECGKSIKARVNEEIDKPGEPNLTNSQINNWYRICLIEKGLPPRLLNLYQFLWIFFMQLCCTDLAGFGA